MLNFRMILKDVPAIEGTTTIHFPDIDVAYFRSLLDFLYSGQTCVPATDVEHLHDLLDLLQIKPGVWRTGDKNGKETVEVLSRIFTEKNQKLNDHHDLHNLHHHNIHHHHHHHTHTDINSNEGSDTTARLRRSKSRDSSPSQLSVKRERLNESSCDDDDRNDLDDEDVEPESLHINDDRLQKIRSAALKICSESNFLQPRDSTTEDVDDNERNVDEDEDEGNDENAELKPHDIGERRRSSSDPVNLSLGFRDRDDESNDGHIDVETIGNAPSKVSNKYSGMFVQRFRNAHYQMLHK